jgi:hypothetical protein
MDIIVDLVGQGGELGDPVGSIHISTALKVIRIYLLTEMLCSRARSNSVKELGPVLLVTGPTTPNSTLILVLVIQFNQELPVAANPRCPTLPALPSDMVLFDKAPMVPDENREILDIWVIGESNIRGLVKLTSYIKRPTALERRQRELGRR